VLNSSDNNFPFYPSINIAQMTSTVGKKAAHLQSSLHIKRGKVSYIRTSVTLGVVTIMS